jgi:hypothetical protein
MEIKMIGIKMLELKCVPIYLVGGSESVLYSCCLSYPSKLGVEAKAELVEILY